MILVLLGTQNNSFHRLLDEVQKCIDNEIIKEEVIVQSGNTEYKSKDMKIFDLISSKKINELMDKADIIITHGGVGSIVSCLKKHKKIIAIPRLKKYGEHVNDHQIQIIENFDKQEYIKGVFKIEELEDTIKNIIEFIPKEYISNTEKVINIVEDFINRN